MNKRNPFWSRKDDSPYFIKEDRGGWRVCKRGRSGEVYDVARRWFRERGDAERVRGDFSEYRSYRNPSKRIGGSEAPYAIILADYDDRRLARAYGNVRPSNLDEALRDVDRFYRRWKKDPNYELAATEKARSRLLSQLQALGQGELEVNPGGLDKWFGEKWVDVCDPPDNHKKAPHEDWKPCGRQDDEARSYPKCRPLRTARKMSRKEMRAACRRKRAVESREDDMSKGRPPNMVNPITRMDRMQMEPHMFGLPRQHKYPLYKRMPNGEFVFCPRRAALAKSYAEDEYERGILSAEQLEMVRDRANRLLRRHR